MTDLMVFTGNANPELAQKIVDHLGMQLGEVSVSQFSDGEVAVELLTNVRGRDVFVVQSTCAPTNDNLIELIVMCKFRVGVAGKDHQVSHVMYL